MGKYLERKYVHTAINDKNLKLQTFVTFSIQLWNDKGTTLIINFSETGDYAKLKSYHDSSKLNSSAEKLSKLYNDLSNSKRDIKKSLQNREDKVDYYIKQLFKVINPLNNERLKLEEEKNKKKKMANKNILLIEPDIKQIPTFRFDENCSVSWPQW